MASEKKSPPSAVGAKSRTRVAVLGALSVEAMTGYEIHQNIETTIGHFWHESFGQIYPVLKDLERTGLVRADPAATGRGRQFTITPNGIEELKDLLVNVGSSPPPRNTLLLQLFFGRLLGPAWCRERIAEARREAEAQLAIFDAIAAEIASEEGYEQHREYWMSTVEFGRIMARALVDWADVAVTSLPTEE